MILENRQLESCIFPSLGRNGEQYVVAVESPASGRAPNGHIPTETESGGAGQVTAQAPADASPPTWTQNQASFVSLSHTSINAQLYPTTNLSCATATSSKPQSLYSHPETAADADTDAELVDTVPCRFVVGPPAPAPFFLECTSVVRSTCQGQLGPYKSFEHATACRSTCIAGSGRNLDVGHYGPVVREENPIIEPVGQDSVGQEFDPLGR